MSSHIKLGEGDIDPSVLDNRERFSMKITCPAVKVNKRNCGTVSGNVAVRNYLLRLPKTKPVYDVAEDAELRYVCFDPAKVAADFSDISEDLAAVVNSSAVLEKTTFEVVRGYEAMSTDEVLAQLVPEHHTELTTAFETVGHIAHFNMRGVSEPWRFVIARLVMEKNPCIKTCVNKLHIMEKFRNLNLELIGGEPNFSASLKENGIKLRVEYDKVYWNTRLSNERTRLLALMDEGDVLCDAMGGIGAFAVHAANKGLVAFANDLNPDSALGAMTNFNLNKIKPVVTAATPLFENDTQAIYPAQTEFSVSQTPLLSHESHGQAFNLDGRQFIHNTADKYGIIAACHAANRRVHFVMNLPEIAIEFIDAFRGLFTRARAFAPALFTDAALQQHGLPKVRVHVHCFARPPTQREEIEGRVKAALGGKLPSGGVDIAEVRDVAPNKFMFCASFDVDAEIGFEDLEEVERDINSRVQVGAVKRAAEEQQEEDDEEAAKKAKTE